jgi:zinc transporter ZupT
MKDFLSNLGLELSDIVAGFFGGVVNALIFKKPDPWSIASSVVVGALTAAYFSAWMSLQFNIGRGTAGFVVGLCAMAICQGIVEMVKNKIRGVTEEPTNEKH